MTYDELMSALYDLMEEDPEDLEDQVDELLEENDGDPEDAFLAAVQADNFGYVRDHVASIELMTEDGSTSPYVEEAGSEEMRQELIEDGASLYLGDVTDGHDFAWNVETGDVLEENDDFVDGVYEDLLDELGMTEQELAEAAIAEARRLIEEENEGEDEEDYADDIEALYPQDGEEYTEPWFSGAVDEKDGTEVLGGYTLLGLAEFLNLTWNAEEKAWEMECSSDPDTLEEIVSWLSGYETDEFTISAPHGHGGEWLRWIDKVKD